MDFLYEKFTNLSHACHRFFLPLLVSSYLMAAFFPSLGLHIRGCHLGTLCLLHFSHKIYLPMCMLALLLFNAGLGIKHSQMKRAFNRPKLILSGLLANSLLPIVVLSVMGLALHFWHSSKEANEIIIGFIIVGAMPIAGSSTAWTQNADGDVTTILALVLLSTTLSPIITPVFLGTTAHILTGEYARAVGNLSGNSAWFIILACVFLPSFLGIIVRGFLSDAQADKIKPILKLLNFIDLLLLNYSNASLALPRVVASPDWDFLVLIFSVTILFVVTAFAAGWGVATYCGASREERISLMFGLGMNNTGTGLVIASLALSEFPRTFLPIIAHTLVQHLIAGSFDAFLQRPGWVRAFKLPSLRWIPILRQT